MLHYNNLTDHVLAEWMLLVTEITINDLDVRNTNVSQTIFATLSST